MSSQYTAEQYRTLTVARQFGAQQALQQLEEHVRILAEEAGGPDAWLTDPRRPGIDEAVAVIASHIGNTHLSEPANADLTALIEMSDNVDLAAEVSKHIGIEEARKTLGDLVTAAQQGTDIILTRNRRPVARITRHQEDTMTAQIIIDRLNTWGERHPYETRQERGLDITMLGKKGGEYVANWALNIARKLGAADYMVLASVAAVTGSGNLYDPNRPEVIARSHAVIGAMTPDTAKEVIAHVRSEMQRLNPAGRAGCHYCGLPVNGDGDCEECV